MTTTASSSFNDKHVEHRFGYEMATYASDDWKVNDKLNMAYGLRLSAMLLVGPGTFSTYDAAGNTIGSQQYKSGELVQHYLNLEPRFSVSYLLNEQQSIKASYNRNTQNIHLLTNSTSASPTDLYVMSSKNIKPEIADQFSTGYFRNFKDNLYEFSAEVYYKNLQNQIDYKDAAQLLVNQDVESQLVYGVGRAYGVELFLKKNMAVLMAGWVIPGLKPNANLMRSTQENTFLQRRTVPMMYLLSVSISSMKSGLSPVISFMEQEGLSLIQRENT
ncbi:TonB-dependent receptor [Sphingobacterium sp. E70]|uniref:TonB-dependent receptor domain-containing protein n=1 Tax=Sphingobacterium sp. E70 TaxID=2853439 RepID=UPI0027957FD7|nr:TonB-dependent receptor [Sphingobacterium sp. E70]